MPGQTFIAAGIAFRQARNDLSWSQETLAERSGFSLGTVKNAEKGRPITPGAHRNIIAALNKGLASESPPRPMLVIPFPCGAETEIGRATHATGSNGLDLPTAVPLDNPHLSALREALRHIDDRQEELKLRMGEIRSPAELRDLWLIDNSAYGNANIAFEHLSALWKAFPLGLRVLFFENEIMGAMGIWPVSRPWAERLQAARLREAQLKDWMIRRQRNRPTDCWYVTGIVLREQLIGGRGSKMLLRDGLGSWLRRAKIKFPCQILALAFSQHGRRLLERFQFFRVQDEVTMPDKCPLYRLDLSSRSALIELLRQRRLDAS
jgi:transcriptional regulator with XRE-family HTH domain